MNDDSTSIPATASEGSTGSQSVQATTRDSDAASNAPRVALDSAHEVVSGIQHGSIQDAGSPAQTRAKGRVLEQTKKRIEFLDNIMTSLNILIYVEMVIVYYMDNSFFRLLFRAYVQHNVLSPKPALPPSKPQHVPYIPGLIISGAFCLLMHILTSLPTASESTRGYLHGSVSIDFIGQRAPWTKWQLVLLDILISVLQVVMLAVHVELERAKSVVKDDTTTTPAGPATESTTVPGQDHNAEERGQIREMANAQDIEMQPLSSSRQPPTTTSLENEAETDRLLEETVGSSAVEPPEGALDVFYSGNIIVADLHILNTLRTVRSDSVAASESALQSVGHSTAYNLARMQQRLARM